MKVTLCKKAKLKKESEKKFEIHFNHYDMFIVIKGSMKIIIGTAVDKRNIHDYNKTKDFGTLKNSNSIVEIERKLNKHEYLIVEPGIVHKPGLIHKHKKCTFYIIKIEKGEKE